MDWANAWGSPSPFYRRQLAELRRALEELADGIPLIDEEAAFGAQVTPGDNEVAPVHRWYAYKEAFSYRLPKALVGRLGSGRSGFVADPFGGVATTALALQGDPRVHKVVSIEYSPLAHLVGQAKLSWHKLSPPRLRVLTRRVLGYREDASIDIPDLAAFHNREIFRPRVVRSLLSARDRLDRMSLTVPERAFFLTGLAAVVEDLSGAMKDGRALRIRRDRQRRRKHLLPEADVNHQASQVKHALACQWTAMIEDLEVLAVQRRRIVPGHSMHLRGDARDIGSINNRGGQVFEAGSVGLFAYSPPYLNCIDYSEVYKLELWLLELVSSQEEFRKLRLGTLRSHPSVEFPPRDYMAGAKGTAVFDTVAELASFVERNHARAQMGRMIRNYFDDMFQVFVEQYRALEPGGHAVSVVGNSTFSRRDKGAGYAEERWRIPLLTDVILARLAQVAGLEEVGIWHARDLRPRNVNVGSARESLVVGRRPRV